MPKRHIDLVEKAYELQSPGATWLTEVASSLSALDESAISTFVFECERRDDQLVLGNAHSEDERVLAQLPSLFTEVPADLLDVFYRVPLLASSMSDVLANKGIELDQTPLWDLLQEADFVDIFALSAVDPLGAGISIGVGLGRRMQPSPAQQREWAQVAAHLAAGHRLRRRLGATTALDSAELVLSTSGKVEHAEPGIDDPLRAQLGQAVERVEQARARGRHGQDALELWQALIAGQWSLADHFETSGRRYYVAIRNPPAIVSNKTLTRRETEVVSYIASGTTTGATAYALGLDEVTVRGYLHTALAKLGLRSRAELISVRAMLLASAEPGPDRQ